MIASIGEKKVVGGAEPPIVQLEEMVCSMLRAVYFFLLLLSTD